MRLLRDGLTGLPAGVALPAYDPGAIGVGIVHLGLGAFHRAHQAVYVDDLIARGDGDWRILGVSLRSAAVREQLAPQDGLFTLVVRDGDTERRRIVGSVAGVLVASEDPAAVIAAIAAPATQLVTLTITEKGYCHDPASGVLDREHPDTVHDLAHPDRPRSAIGYLAAGLAARRERGAGPLTVMSCDNLPHNGAVLRRVLLAFAEARDPALGQWIEANVAFPATMVDRIVPATTDADRAALAAALGVEDAAMVKAEPFSQWVIEDRFAGARPAFDTVGAQLVADVRPFELAKLRMLNGAHSALAYLGLAAGHVHVDEAIGDRAITPIIDALMIEAAATLPAVPGLDTAAYAQALKARFANSALQHRLAQIAIDGSQKLPQRLLGTIVDTHDAGGEAIAAATGVAAWIAHLDGPWLADPLADALRTAAAKRSGRVERVLGVSAVFGAIGREAWFRELIGKAYSRLA